MTKPRWSKIYERFFPDQTCPMSRHVKTISEQFRRNGGPLHDAVSTYDDPVHVAESLEGTVIALWEARSLLADLGYDRVLVNKRYVWRLRT